MQQRPRLAIVYGMLPLTDEINQFSVLSDKYDIDLVSTSVVCEYVKANTFFENLNYVSLSDYKDNPTYVAGLEKALKDYSIVILKERTGLYAYQTLKAKWQYHFKLIVWCDNLYTFWDDTKDEFSTIRSELNLGADLFITQTKQGVDSLISEGVTKDRITYFAPWIKAVKDESLTPQEKLKIRHQVREDLGYCDSNFVITHLGQREWEEGLDDFLLGVKKAVDEDSYLRRQLQIVFCGIGTYTSKINDLTIKLGLEDRVKFLNPGRESIRQLAYISDAMYLSFIPYQERKEGDPQRVLFPMSESIPILASRSSLVEETCEKHRIDFCVGSFSSIAQGIKKIVGSKALVKDIVTKNDKKISTIFTKERFLAGMDKILDLDDRVENSGRSLERLIVEAESLVQSKQYVKAIDLIENIFKTQSLASHHRSNLYRLIGDSFIKLNDTQGATEAYKEALLLDKYFYKAYVGLGTVCLIQEKFEIAVLNFQKAVALMPNDEMTNLGLALSFQGLKEPREALKWILKSLEINPDNKEAIYSLVKLAAEMDEYSDAEHILTSYVKRHPLDHNMIYALASICFKQSKLELADSYIGLILDKDPTDERAYILRKKIRYQLDSRVETSRG